MKFSVGYEENMLTDMYFMTHRGKEVADGIKLRGRNQRTKMAHYEASVIRYLKLKREMTEKELIKGWV